MSRCGPLRLLRQHARANIFFYQQFEVGVNLFVEI
jgi:hypothetical protein